MEGVTFREEEESEVEGVIVREGGRETYGRKEAVREEVRVLGGE